MGKHKVWEICRRVKSSKTARRNYLVCVDAFWYVMNKTDLFAFYSVMSVYGMYFFKQNWHFLNFAKADSWLFVV